MPETILETYRGVVASGECDAFGHLNIAFYPERFEAAAMDLRERLGVSAGWRTRRLDTRYLREFRAGEGIAVRSFVLGSGDGLVHLAHEGITLAGERSTLAEHYLATEGGDALPLRSARLWEPFPDLAWRAGEGSLAAGRDRVAAMETDADGMGLFGYVRRFSSACLCALEAIGMTEAYRRDAGRGFATFETRLALEAQAPRAGDGIAVTSAILVIGTSSLRLQHTMRTTLDGRLLARFHQAGVHFDLNRRKGAPWPPELRAKAMATGAATS